MPFIYLFIFSVVLGVGGFSLERVASLIDEFELPSAQYGLLGKTSREGTILFGGDIMLGRSVENIMNEHGGAYPFLGIAPLIASHTAAVANFEAPVPETHIQTRPNTMEFSVARSAMEEVKRAGFDVLSLSNNHALDHGEEGYAHTVEVCRELSIACVGHPTRHDERSFTTTEVGDTTVGLLMLNMIYEAPATSTLTGLIQSLKDASDIQYVFIHWGDEYERVHNREQEAFAHFLIDEGVDGVIGHHPHVMQDIELYKGKPIFYSLGNLIFDQYFNRDVQEGYLLSVAIDEDSTTYTLLPYDAHDSRSQPQLQTGELSATTIRTLMRYPLFSSEEIHNGAFTTLRD